MSKLFGETNKIYRISWKNNRNGYAYRLEMRASFDGNLLSPDIVDLPNGLLINFNYQWEYENYYIGFKKLPYFDFDIDLSLLDGGSDTHDFNVFAKLIYENTAGIRFNKYIGSYPFDTSFTAGNLWTLYLAKDGSSYEVVSQTIQDQKSANNLDIPAKKFHIETKNIITALMQAVPQQAIFYFLYYFYKENLAALGKYLKGDFHYTDFEQTKKSIHHYNLCGAVDKKYVFHGAYVFAKLSDFIVFIQDYLLMPIYQKMVRSSTANLNFNISYPSMYEQTYDNSGDRGALATDILFMPVGTTKYSGSEFDFSSTNYAIGALPKLNDMFPSLFDFMSDLAKSFGASIQDNYSSDTDIDVYFQPIFPNLQITVDDIDFIDLKTFKDKKNVENVVVSFSDNKDNDIGEVSYLPKKSTGQTNSRNDVQLQVQSTFHNIPVWSAKFYKSPSKHSYASNTTHDLQLFYYNSSEDMIFRIHSNVNFDFGNSIDSDTLVIDTEKIVNNTVHSAYIYPKKEGNDTAQQNKNGMIMKAQNKNGWNYILAESYYKLLHHSNQNLITGKIELEKMSSIPYNYNSALNSDRMEFKINYSEIKRPITNMITDINANYKFTKVKIGLITGNPNDDDIIEFEALSRYA